MHRVSVERDLALPVERVFAHLAEHESLQPLFGARVERVRDGTDGHRNGVGSVRRLKVGPGPWFEETVTEFVPNKLIRYRITKGSPLRDHEGVMRFEPRGAGTRLSYTITFRGAVPGVGLLVRLMLDRSIREGLRRLDARA
jgi:uncharacterized protein YndB with AHSA1/START domain